MDYEKLYGSDKPLPKLESDDLLLPETDDLVELANAAIPGLVKRAITLANMSNRLPDVMSVLNSMMDRAKGKPHQAVEHTGKITHETLIIQRSVPSLPVVEAEAVELPTRVDEIV